MNDPAVQLFQTRIGPLYAFRSDEYLTRSLDAYGDCSPRERAVLEQLIRPGSTVVEVGANIGLHTIPMARRCSPGRLIAFEPQKRVFDVLGANLTANHITNVEVRLEACGEGDGWATVPRVDYEKHANIGGVSLAEDGVAGDRVPVVTIDGLGLEQVRLVKVDVEGWEVQVLRGAVETIKRCRPRIYIENDRREHQQLVMNLLRELGYRLYWHLPTLAPPDVLEPVFGRVLVSVNMLAMPVESRGSVSGLPPIDPDNWNHPLDVVPGSAH